MLETKQMKYIRKVTSSDVEAIVKELVVKKLNDNPSAIILAPGDMVTIARIINKFPEYVGIHEFINAIKFFEKHTGVIESGFWWELIEQCLVKRTAV